MSFLASSSMSCVLPMSDDLDMNKVMCSAERIADNVVPMIDPGDDKAFMRDSGD